MAQPGGDRAPRPALFCGRLRPATPPPDLAAWLESDRPAGCFAVYGHFVRRGKKLGLARLQQRKRIEHASPFPPPRVLGSGG